MKIVIDDVEYSGLDCTKHARACIIDTGTPGLLLPYQLASWLGGFPSKLQFYLEGAHHQPPVVLDFDLTTMTSVGTVQVMDPPKAMWDPLLVLGLPLWAHYYTLFNLTGDTVSFTRH